MFSTELLVVLLVGTVFMLVPILIQINWYQIDTWKSIPIALLLTISGTLGTKLLFYIENQRFGGQSFYGAIFLVPILFLIITQIVHVPYGKLMDLCAPAECVMLAIMKTQCAATGCCSGRVVFYTADGTAIIFPSQIVELIVALAIFVILLLMSKKEGNREKIYAWYLVLYGSTRFVLNFLRRDIAVFALGLSAGSFWSVWAFAIGLIWIHLATKKKTSERNS